MVFSATVEVPFSLSMLSSQRGSRAVSRTMRRSPRRRRKGGSKASSHNISSEILWVGLVAGDASDRLVRAMMILRLDSLFVRGDTATAIDNNSRSNSDSYQIRKIWSRRGSRGNFVGDVFE
jgi:hypothetical protein